MSDTTNIVRKINVGRITGLSTYELAKKHGFEGTEQEFVDREMKIFNDIQNLAKTIPGFNEIKCGDTVIQASIDNKMLNIDTDDTIDITIDSATNTLKVGLSQKFKESIAYIKDEVDNL